VNTRKTYETEARRFFSYLKGTRLKEVRVAELLKFQAALSETRATSSVALTLSVVRAIFSFGFRLGYLERDLGSFLKPPRVDRSLNERILSESEVQRLFAAARPDRDRLLLKTIYVAGLRISEALTLTCADLTVREDGGQITVHGKGGRVREVLLPAGLFLELQEFVSERSGSAEFLFSSRNRAKSPLSRFQAFRVLKDAALKAGLPETVSPHWLRHAHATHALERGCPVHLVQGTLGHSSLSVTGRYLHARPEDSSARYLG
jgi:integrase/recombinase XerD